MLSKDIMHLWKKKKVKQNNKNLKLLKFILKILNHKLYYFLKNLKKINMNNYYFKQNKEINHLVQMQEFHYKF